MKDTKSAKAQTRDPGPRTKPPSMRIAGIDPGTRRVGYCILEKTRGGFAALTIGTLRPQGRTVAERLAAVFQELDALFARYRPRAVAVETQFVGKNAATALTIGMGRAVALVCAARCGAAVAEYAPGEAKRAVGAAGGSGKADVQRLVQLLLRLREPLPPDASDAVALALCHAWRS